MTSKIQAAHLDGVALLAMLKGFAIWALAAAAVLPLTALAQNVTAYDENGDLKRGSKTITPLGKEIAGERVDLYTGSVSIGQIDVSLPGNDDLRVEYGRRYDLSSHFFGWDPEIPRISGSFMTPSPLVAGGGWTVSGSTTPQKNLRCSNFSPPGLVMAKNGTGAWEADEYWSGHRLYVPGEVNEVMLKRAPGNARVPSVGSYPIVTKSNWQIGCVSLVLGTGEGFVALSPKGVKYVFDRMTVRQYGGFSNSTGSAARQEVWILPSSATDRFGNYVNYTYDAANPMRVTAIDSSDGRHLTFTYQSSGAYTVSDGTRTWSYSADGMTVTLPDSTQWIYSLNKSPTPSSVYPAPHCENGAWYNPPVANYPLDSTVTHPSGVQVKFSLNFVRHAVTFSGASPCQGISGTYYFDRGPYPTFDNFALKTKTISGPGIPTQAWNFSWGPLATSGIKTLVVQDPKGDQTRYTFSNGFNAEGEVLQVDEGWTDPTALKTTTTSYVTAGGETGDAMRSEVTLQDVAVRQPSLRTITQQGKTFTYQANSFDDYGRPAQVTRTGPNGLGANVSITETTTYDNNTLVWVVGQIDRVVTSDGKVKVDNDYDTAKATLSSTKTFGVTQATFGYNTDGTLASKSDGLGNTTNFADYYRGIPRQVSYPTGFSEYAVVNNIGLITQVTSTAGYATGYSYDAIGRLSGITPPGGFTAISITFAKAPGAAYGLPAGHWVQTITKGNAKTETYLDSLWRPRMTRTWDTQAEAATRKVTVKDYDLAGNASFDSYVQRDFSTVAVSTPGTRSQYDALARVTQAQVDSELGVLTTSTSYLSGFQTQVTNPRGKITTQNFWALDDPSKAQLASIAAPENVSVSVTRDAFGKPTSITRSGTSINTNAGYASSVTRRYVYDAGQRLCKTVEPEVGSTVQIYDAAGNVQWKAPGQALPDPNACNDASVAASAKLTYGYDNLNRLTSVGYGDASPGVTRTYTPDGLLATVTSNGSTWTYGYNALRKPTSESLAYAGQTYGIGWAYNTQGDLNALTYPGAVALGYGVNALGEIESISGYASNITYHPNGAVAGYTLGNGIAHTLTQNTRGLPWVNTDAGVMQDGYAYDANGNITGIVDQQEGVSTRSMTYDDLDRLAGASAPNVWGNATYKYDTVDNLRSAVVGARASTINVDSSTNQVSTVVTNGTTANYNFDPRGNLTGKGGQTFGFDLGNRLSWSSAGGSYAYDGQGRRIKISSSDGSTRIQVYSQAGQLLWATSTGGPRPTSTTAYIYLGGKQIAESNSVSGTQYVHTDALGSPVAHTGPTGALINRSRFEPYGYVAAGTKPSANTSVIGFTGHVQDAETDLVYMQQRYYDPIAGRFLSVDPVVTDANTGKGFGLYTYVDNNPYARVDPDGRNWVMAGIGAGLVACSRSPACVRAGIALMAATGKAISNALQNAAKPEESKPAAPKPDEVKNEEGDRKSGFPDRNLPRDENGNPTPEPDAEGPHSQLGQKDGRNGKYDQAREFDENGKPVRDIDFTDHGRPKDHPKPHQHRYIPNETGGTPKRGPTEPLPKQSQ